MKADEIVERIGKGVHAAFKTKELFLGVEVATFENTDIHPEYVTTVKVGEALTAPNHVVILEAHMKQLRAHAGGIARMKSITKTNDWPKIDLALKPYTFGRRDSERLDVLVLDSDTNSPPILMAEAKLGVGNRLGVIRDINRIVRLFDMYEAVGARGDATYGAVVFHFMEEDSSDDQGDIVLATTKRAQPLLKAINTHLEKILRPRSWLKAKAGLLTSAERVEATSGYVEVYDDQTTENVFGKHGFRFVPGLILLGSASDVNTASF